MNRTTDQRPDTATLEVKVLAPNAVEPIEFSWPKNMKVSEAAAAAASEFGIEGGTPSLENEDDELLDGNQPLVAAGVRDGACLELVDIGGGV